MMVILNGDLEKAYAQDARKSIKEVNAALKKLAKNLKDKAALKDLIKGSHTLKGNSLQMGYYSVAYLAKLIKDIAFDIDQGKRELNEELLVFLRDFGLSLDKALQTEIEGKRFKLAKSFMKKLNEVTGESFSQK